ncbi:hypothetical protein FN846DRAFT_695474 [Sphaerosporella brunnea]|uniref:Cell wall proline rich protein n=1 Tax=Sphaerosporella brunnea TaxID=1250544 RepID=A0A5J5EYT6_9PEZI|nr:hypothetical protein FN846DRAFT_695474 [Sphaerosporella brunnea]
MATTAHTREPSIPSFDFDPSFSFPSEREQDRPKSTGSRYPPQYVGHESYAFPPRRGSLPLTSAMLSSLSSAQPRTSQTDALKQLNANSKLADARGTNPPSPDYSMLRPRGRTIGDGVAPTVLNASVRMSYGPDRSSSSSDLLQVPMLEPKMIEKDSIPIQKRAPPPPGVNLRKGHAHRRSGAISSSDVWSLMSQPAPPLPTSVKVSSASNGDQADGVSPGASPRVTWTPGSPQLTAENAPPALDDLEGPSDGRRNSRVVFMEGVEIIPRPTSSETDSTKTVKHGVTSSVGTTSPAAPLRIDTTARTTSPARRPHNRTRSNSQTLAQPTAALRAVSDRPSTAGAILASPQKPNAPELDIPEVPSLKRPACNSPFVSEESCASKPPASKKSHKKAKSDFSPLLMPGEFQPDGSAEALSEDGKKKKKSKKQIKNWAGNILGKGKKSKRPKGSRKSKKSKRAPTPPVSKSAEHLTPGQNEWVATSWNESYVIMPIDTSPALDAQKVTLAGGVGSPVIDLDAALGPFKTPVETYTGFAAARRRMHSAASRGGGSYFHRRSESMPEMQLFALEEDEDRAMEDVFEEEDEDETTSEEESSEEESDDEDGQIGGGSGLGIGFNTGDELPKNTETVYVSHGADGDKRLSTSTITPATASANIPGRSGRPVSLRKNVPADIITPETSPEASATFRHSFLGPPLDSPSTFHTATSSPNTPIQGDFSGDESSCSFNPYLDYLGEPGPEMRMSADDIPSLTSSSSTMTMNAIYAGMPSTPGANETPSPAISVAKEKKEKGRRWSRIWTFWKSK